MLAKIADIDQVLTDGAPGPQDLGALIPEDP